MALSASRNTPAGAVGVLPQKLNFGVAASTHIYKGGLVALNSSGYLVPVTAATGLIIAGKASFDVDNSAGSNGTLTCDVEQGVFIYTNSTSTDQILATDAGKVCWGVSDSQVAKTSATATRSQAGVICGLDASGNVLVACGLVISSMLDFAV